jgi:hypothetical protein
MVHTNMAHKPAANSDFTYGNDRSDTVVCDASGPRRPAALACTAHDETVDGSPRLATAGMVDLRRCVVVAVGAACELLDRVHSLHTIAIAATSHIAHAHAHVSVVGSSG